MHCSLHSAVKSQTRSQAVARLADRTAPQHLWGHVTLSVTWPFDTPYVIFIGGPLERSLYLQLFSRYCALSVLGSRVWPFKVTWRHRSRDHLIAHMPFPLEPIKLALSVTVSEIFNVKCNAMVDVTLIRPLNEGQGHSFWYQSISHTRFPIGCQYGDAPFSHNT